MLRIILAAILGLALTSCGYDGHYRYPCQDPANWENAECKPPICTVNGACPEDLVGTDVINKTSDMVNETSSDIIEETKNEPSPENVDNINEMVKNISEGD